MTTWIFYTLISVIGLIVGLIGVYIVTRLISSAVFTSYFEEKFKHHDLKGDSDYGKEDRKEE